MAILAENNAALVLGGTDVKALWTDKLSYEQKNSPVVVTHGAGVDHEMREPGLNSTTISFALVFDISALASYRAKVVVGAKVLVEYGPDGSGSGSPKFECNMIVTRNRMVQEIAKELVKFELDLEAVGAPVGTIEGGHTWL